MTQINKILDGVVVSDKAEKTVIVSVSSRAKTKYKGKTIKYSNENYFQLLNQVFNNINNIFEYEISRNKKWYDDKDGHNNYEINKGIFKKLSKYILELN